MSVIILDQFTAADNTPINGRTPSPTNNGTNWSDPDGGGKILSNSLNIINNYFGNKCLLNIPSGDMTIEFDMKGTASGGYFWGLLRGDGTGKGIMLVWLNDTTLEIVTEAWGSLGAGSSGSATFAANVFKHYKIVFSGNNIKVYYDNSGSPVIDCTTTYSAGNTGIGMSTYGATAYLDNLSVDNGVVPIPNWVSTYPKASTVTNNTIKLLVEIDQNGTAYFVCLPSGSTAPTSAQVKAGQDGSGNALASNLKGSVSLTANVEGNFTATGIAPGVGCDIYLVAEDNGGLQASPVLVSQTTISSAPADPNYLNSSLASKTIVTFSLNLGSTLATPIDITQYITNNQSISEGLTDKSNNIGGVILDKLVLELDNTNGVWEQNGSFFKGGFVNNSVITITTFYYKYVGTGAFDGEFGIDFDAGWAPAGNPYVFTGLLKTASSQWDENPNSLKFLAGVLPVANILATETVNPGYVTPGSFTSVINQIMLQPTIAKYISTSLSNIVLGYDAAGVVDTPAELTGMTVKDVLDKIAFLSGSIYRFDSNNIFYMEPIANSGTSTWNLRQSDITEFTALEFDPLQFTQIQWTGATELLNTITVTQDYLTRQMYQYDFNQLTIDAKFVQSDAARLAIIQNMLLQYQHQHHRIVLRTKSNPDLRVNNLITVNYPQQCSLLSFVWNKSSWGDGSTWSISIPGVTISPVTFWRVLQIDRDILNESMTITAIVASKNTDGGI